jgi:hypothetical protein
MAITYQWANESRTVIKVTLEDGSEYWVPTDPGNRHYAEILEQEIEPLPPEPPNPEETP